MKKNTSIIFFILLLFPINLFSQNKEEIYNKVKQSVVELSQDPLMEGGIVGFSLRDPLGKEVVAYNSEIALIPASNLKAITTATALKVLGKDFRFKTDILFTGEIKEGVLKGDIVIRGSGDPTLGGGRIEGNPLYEELISTWVEKIKEKGIKKVEGRVIQDFSCLDKNMIPGGWIWEDIGNYYGGGVSGLNINENLYTLTFRPGKKPGDSTEIVRIEPHIPGLVIENNVLTGTEGSGDNAWIFGSPYSNYRYISGTIPAGVTEFSIKGSIPDPAFLTVHLLTKELRKRDVSVKEDPLSSNQAGCKTNRKGTLIYSHFSPYILEIIDPTNKKSINLYAEALYKTTENRLRGLDSDKNFLLEYWKSQDVQINGNYILDGSGLSPRNTIQTSFISEVMFKMSQDVLAKEFISTLPVSGESGTLSRFCKGTIAEKRILAKSGSMARVIGYSGYLKGRDGKLFSFCILVNNYEGKTSGMVKNIEKIMLELAGL